jgi:hypothetical protein
MDNHTANAEKRTSAAPPARPKRPVKPAGPLGVSSLEVYPLREAQRRLRWGRKTMTRAQRDGLRSVAYGREKYIRGAEILRFFEALESNQAGSAGPAASNVQTTEGPKA